MFSETETETGGVALPPTPAFARPRHRWRALPCHVCVPRVSPEGSGGKAWPCFARGLRRRHARRSRRGTVPSSFSGGAEAFRWAGGDGPLCPRPQGLDGPWHSHNGCPACCPCIVDAWADCAAGMPLAVFGGQAMPRDVWLRTEQAGLRWSGQGKPLPRGDFMHSGHYFWIQHPQNRGW